MADPKDKDDTFGVGTGTASGAVTGAAIGTAIGGPIGTAIGAVAGAITGAVSGKGISDAVQSTEEDAYWQSNHSKASYSGGKSYDHFAPAYKTGYEGYDKFEPGTKFEEAEEHLRSDYKEYGGESKLPWTEAKHAAQAAWGRVERGEASRIQLSEEQLSVRKQQVEAGAVRLRKVVRSETVNTPVELRREDVIVERTNVTGGTVPADAFTEGEISVPLTREEAVVTKTAHVTGEVGLRKESHTDTENVSGTVRKEDVVVEREGEARLSTDETVRRDR